MKNRPLTEKQKKYCRERVKGKTKADSYFAAGYSKGNSKVSAKNAALMLEKDYRIQAELERLTRLAEQGAIMDRKQRLSLLTEMASDDSRKDDARQRAIDMLNRMTGDYNDKTITEIKGSLDISLDDKRQMILNALKADN